MTEIPLSQLRPPKHKLREDIGDLSELTLSIKTHGVLEPLLVRPYRLDGEYNVTTDKFEIIAGERRFVACTELGLTQVPCTVIVADDAKAFEIALIENMQRKDMGVIDEAKAFNSYITEYGYGSMTELAKKIGKTPGFVNDRIGLLKLPKETVNIIASNKMSHSHGEAMAGLDAEKAAELTTMITSEGTGKPYLDVATTQRAVSMVKRGAGVEQAVEWAIEQPDWNPAKEHTKFDPVKMARESMVSQLEKTLKLMDDNINRIPEGEEHAKWIALRYIVHQTLDSAMKLEKAYRKRED